MFGIGFSELIVLSIILFLILGPDRLPDLMRGMGKFTKHILRAKDELNRSIEGDDQLRNIKDSVDDMRKDIESRIDEVKRDIESNASKDNKDSQT